MEAVLFETYNDIMHDCKHHMENLKIITEASLDTPLDPSLEENNIPVQRNIITLAKNSQNILKIGFEGIGYSTLIMLIANPQCRITIFDTCEKKYIKHCYKYLEYHFPNRLKLYKGKSNNLYGLYFRERNSIADLCIINDSYELMDANNDFFRCKQFSCGNSIIVFNHIHFPHLQNLWNGYVNSRDVIPLTLVPTDRQGIGRSTKPLLKIAICSVAIGEEYKKIIRYGRQTKLNYCHQYNYDFFEDEDLDLEQRPPAWAKVKLILRYLYHTNKYDYIVWIDADTHIMNNELSLEYFISQLSNNKDITIANDGATLNSGVMFIKNTDWSKKFFNELWQQTDYINHPNWEQGAIINMHETNIINTQEHFSVIANPKLFNAYFSWYTDGDFLIHLAGCWRNGNCNLDKMMDRFCPIRMDSDTDESYSQRLEFIRNHDYQRFLSKNEN